MWTRTSQTTSVRVIGSQTCPQFVLDVLKAHKLQFYRAWSSSSCWWSSNPQNEQKLFNKPPYTEWEVACGIVSALVLGYLSSCLTSHNFAIVKKPTAQFFPTPKCLNCHSLRLHTVTTSLNPTPSGDPYPCRTSFNFHCFLNPPHKSKCNLSHPLHLRQAPWGHRLLCHDNDSCDFIYY